MIVCDHVMANFDRHRGNFGLVRTVETLERRLPACRLRSAEWQTATRPRTRRTQLTLMLYIQQLTLITESK